MSNAPEHIDHELLTRYLAGECSDAERIDVEQWSAASEANKLAFEDWKRLWDFAEEPEFKINSQPSAKAKSALEKMQSRISAVEETDEIPSIAPKKTRRIWTGIAASIAVIVTAVFAYYYSGDLVPDHDANTSVAAIDEIKEVTLSDGTKVTLNASSTLYFRREFEGDTREVTLVGEAFFDVHRDTEHPFIIHTNGGADVTVLGTSFNVKAYTDQKEVLVTVSTGKVKLSDADEPEDHVLLVAGEAGAFDEKSEQTSKLENVDPNELFWATGFLSFTKVYSSDIFAELEPLYNVKITMQEGTFLDCKYTGTFDNESIDDIMTILALSLELDVQHNGNEFVISGGNCDQ